MAVSDTTVVTETRTFTVTRKGRKNVERVAVSARSSDVSTQVIEVRQDQPYVIRKHPRKLLQINSEFPLRAVFVQGNSEDAEDLPDEDQYTTGVIYADPLVLNSLNTISVYDPDEASQVLNLVAFNMVTGETENVTLESVGLGMYRGELRVVAKRERGTDFDGCMGAADHHSVKLQYKDSRTSAGLPAVIEAVVNVSTQSVAPMLVARRTVRLGETMGVALFNAPTNDPEVHVLAGGDRHRVSLSHNGKVHAGSIDALDFSVGDEIEFQFQWLDEYGEAQTLTRICRIVEGDTEAQLSAAIVDNRINVLLEDPDLVGETVGVVVVEGEDKFSRVRLYRVAPHVGLYEGQFYAPASVEVRYVDGAVVHSQRIDLPEGEPAPEPPSDDKPAAPEQSAMYSQVEFIINGLFVLNGSFSGIVRLYALEDESVRCSLVHAS